MKSMRMPLAGVPVYRSSTWTVTRPTVACEAAGFGAAASAAAASAAPATRKSLRSEDWVVMVVPLDRFGSVARSATPIGHVAPRREVERHVVARGRVVDRDADRHDVEELGRRLRNPAALVVLGHVEDDLVAADLDVVFAQQVLGYPALLVGTHRLQELARIAFDGVQVDADPGRLLAGVGVERVRGQLGRQLLRLRRRRAGGGKRAERETGLEELPAV